MDESAAVRASEIIAHGWRAEGIRRRGMKGGREGGREGAWARGYRSDIGRKMKEGEREAMGRRVMTE
jgi:hypothetical protein